MPEEGYERRRTDPLIVEMHGLLCTFVAKFEDHVIQDEKINTKVEKIDSRLLPIEDFHGSMRTAGKVVALAGTPIVLGIGATIWAWFKGILIHTKVVP